LVPVEWDHLLHIQMFKELLEDNQSLVQDQSLLLAEVVVEFGHLGQGEAVVPVVEELVHHILCLHLHLVLEVLEILHLHQHQ